MTRKEAARRLRELAYEIYDLVEEMEIILVEVDQGEYKRAKAYWLPRIDGALLNYNGREKSLINLADTIANLEKDDE